MMSSIKELETILKQKEQELEERKAKLVLLEKIRALDSENERLTALINNQTTTSPDTVSTATVVAITLDSDANEQVSKKPRKLLQASIVAGFKVQSEIVANKDTSKILLEDTVIPKRNNHRCSKCDSRFYDEGKLTHHLQACQGKATVLNSPGVPDLRANNRGAAQRNSYPHGKKMEAVNFFEDGGYTDGRMTAWAEKEGIPYSTLMKWVSTEKQRDTVRSDYALQKDGKRGGLKTKGASLN